MSDLTASELDAVRHRLEEAGVPIAGPLTATRIAGGRSNLTYDVTDGSSRWILRTPPRAGRTPSAHDIVREHRFTSALVGTSVPVAPPVLLHEVEDDLGVPFTVSGFVDGETVRTRDQLERLDAPTVDAIVTCLVDALATLHAVDLRSVGLGDMGRPGSYAARQLRRWASQWQTVGPVELTSLAEEAVAQLRGRVPDRTTETIVHGDYRIDNTILALPQQGPAAVRAVVDWELATVGDPAADVAMMAAYRAPAFDRIVGEPAAWTSELLPTPDDLVARYEAAAGRQLQAWSTHLGLAYFKVAVIAAGIDHRSRAASHRDAGHPPARLAIEPYLELALETLRSRD
jgi:aminoglycoside phosphotransferase (APT) family kinase protein